jgi:hypothetical protein
MDGDTFEGYPGSGGGPGAYPRMPSPFTKRPSPDPKESFGPFVGAGAQGRQGQVEVAGDADDDADLGGELYARHSATNSNSGSDSRGSSSNNPPQKAIQVAKDHQQSLTDTVPSGPRRTKKSRSSATSRSTSQSPSLASPVLPPYTDPLVTFVTPTSPHNDGIDPRFPSPGFAGVRSKNRDLGAFLARRGDA